MAGKNDNKDVEIQEERVMTKYDRKRQKKYEEELRAKKKKLAVRGTCIAILAVCAVVVAFLIISSVGRSISYIKVDEKSISKSEFDFYYNRIFNAYASSYSAYYGLDTTQSLDKQECALESGLSWKDYFDKMATDELIRVKALVKDAKANDFKGDVDAEYNKTIELFKETAKAAGTSEEKYFEQTFGASKADVEEYMKEYLLAGLWYEQVGKDKEAAIKEDEIEKYYEENKAEYDYVSYYLTEVTPEGVSAETATDEEWNTAMTAAKAVADQKAAVVETEGEFIEFGYQSNLDEILSEWLFDEARVDGETAVLTDNNIGKFDVVKFVKRARSEEMTYDVRVISVSGDAAEIMDKWEKGKKTEDAFIDLVNEYSLDTGTVDGLYQGISKTGLEIEGLADWLYDTNRKAGDTDVFSDEKYTYVVYFKGENDLEYKTSIRSELMQDALEEWLNGLKDKMKLADPHGSLKYLTKAEEEE